MKQKSIFSFKHLRGESFMFHIRFIKTTMFIDDHFIMSVCLRGIFSRFFEYFTNLKKDINEILTQWIVLFLQNEVAELRRCVRSNWITRCHYWDYIFQLEQAIAYTNRLSYDAVLFFFININAWLFMWTSIKVHVTTCWTDLLLWRRVLWKV